MKRICIIWLPFNDYIWIATAKIFSLITLLILLRLALGDKLKPLSMADALLPPPILFSYFCLAALIYVGVAVEKLGIDVPVLVTREQEVAECLFALGCAASFLPLLSALGAFSDETVPMGMH